MRGLCRRFSGREVFSALDLEVPLGERVALCGPNGAGKTTILRCIVGTLRPTGGRAWVGGHPAGSLPARRLVGASLAQERSFYLRLTGRENLIAFARMRGQSASAAAATVKALERELELGRLASLRVDRCSTGMVQQLAVARALLGDPALLLLDEPTRSLDAAAVERMWAALDRRPALAVLIATHSNEDVVRCARRIDVGKYGVGK